MRLVQHWLTNGNFTRSSLDMSGAFSVIGYLYQDLSLEELRSMAGYMAFDLPANSRLHNSEQPAGEYQFLDGVSKVTSATFM
jgi:hypothetical protein